MIPPRSRVDGSQELYDHEADPHEWTNLAGDERFEEVVEQHRKWLPKTEAEQGVDLKKKPNKGM